MCLKMDANPKLINFNSIPLVQRYLHDATSSHKSSSEWRVYVQMQHRKHEVSHLSCATKAVIPFVFHIQRPLSNNSVCLLV